MSLKKILDKNHQNVTQEYGKIGTTGLVVFGWMLICSFIYTIVSLTRKIRK